MKLDISRTVIAGAPGLILAAPAAHAGEVTVGVGPAFLFVTGPIQDAQLVHNRLELLRLRFPYTTHL